MAADRRDAHPTGPVSAASSLAGITCFAARSGEPMLKVAGRWADPSLVKPERTRGERGASIVELGLIAPVMVMLVFGFLDLGRAYQLHIRAENAAREGAAFAQVHPNDVSGCSGRRGIGDHVASEGEGLATRPDYRLAVFGQGSGGWESIDGCAGDIAQAGERVRVEVTVAFDVLTPMVERVVGGTIDITGAAEVRVQVQG